jgi:hypothetical protein
MRCSKVPSKRVIRVVLGDMGGRPLCPPKADILLQHRKWRDVPGSDIAGSIDYLVNASDR